MDVNERMKKMRDAKEAKKAKEVVPEVPVKGSKIMKNSPYPCPNCMKEKIVMMEYHYLNTLHEHSYCYVSIEYKCPRCEKIWIQEMPQLRQWSEDARGERSKGHSYE
tara:strand:- start:4080 stop:4400 length:321 start_codon:yes stop_codon:yes gene_type:complete